MSVIDAHAERNEPMSEIGSIYVESHGCSANYADGEAIVGALLTAGYRVTDNPQNADFLIYNTCAVKGPTENRMVHLTRSAPRDKKVIITGCLPAINPWRLLKETRWSGVVGAAPGFKILNVISRVNAGERPFDVAADSKPTLSLYDQSRGDVKKTIPIAYGCLSRCGFCAVPAARGFLRSYRPSEIVNQVKAATDRGVKEIWLTATDVGCYGWDIGSDLPSLIEKITNLPGRFLIRLGMMNPAYVKRILPRLIEAYRSWKVYKFIHLPVQSGCNDVLEAMGRGYTVEEFVSMVSEMRKHIQPLTLATDIICGFPTEGEESFRKTLHLLKRIKPDVVNVSKFEPRPYTPASALKPLDGRIVKERSTRTAALARRVALRNNLRWTNWEGEVFVNERGKGDTWMARNPAYKPVVFRCLGNPLGKFLNVKVVGAQHTFLDAVVDP